MSRSRAPHRSRPYSLTANLLRPLALWGRLSVAGLERVPREGPALIVANHDSQMDPVMIGLALRRVRQLRFLARADLWKMAGLGPLLTAMNQIPIERGVGDAAALTRAVQILQEGEAICIFPEGKLSRGERLRARRGVARLAAACPEARVILSAVEGASEFVRFPRRPRVTVTLFDPSAGQPRPGEDPQELATRLLQDTRERVPPAVSGRRFDGSAGRLKTSGAPPADRIGGA